MNIAHSKTRDQFPLSTIKILKKTIAGSMGLILIFLFVFLPIFLSFFFAGPASGLLFSRNSSSVIALVGLTAAVAFLFLALGIFLVYLYQRWYFAVYFYDFTDDYVTIRKGPITPHEITLPYERIQDVYVDQDVFDRILGLYDVHLSTATMTSGMEAHIDGVEKTAADGLRSQLLDTIQRKIRPASSSNLGTQVLQPPRP